MVKIKLYLKNIIFKKLINCLSNYRDKAWYFTLFSIPKSKWIIRTKLINIIIIYVNHLTLINCFFYTKNRFKFIHNKYYKMYEM